MDIKEEKFVPWSEAKRILDRKAKDRELGYEQKNALEHLRKFSKLTQKAVDSIMGELDSIERLKERHKVAIVDMLPRDEDELKMLFSNEIMTISDEDRKKILSTVKKFS